MSSQILRKSKYESELTQIQSQQKELIDEIATLKQKLEELIKKSEMIGLKVEEKVEEKVEDEVEKIEDEEKVEDEVEKVEDEVEKIEEKYINVSKLIPVVDVEEDEYLLENSQNNKLIQKNDRIEYTKKLINYIKNRNQEKSKEKKESDKKEKESDKKEKKESDKKEKESDKKEKKESDNDNENKTLEKMTVPELTKKAKELNLKGISKLRKQELIDLIKNSLN